MRILHCCISCFYIDNYNYQENVIPRLNKLDGHDVQIIASTFTFKENDNKKGDYMSPVDYYNTDGIFVRRRSFANYGSELLNTKIRRVRSFYSLIEDFSPDVILFHGTSSIEIMSLIKYKKNHPHVKIYIDSHADYYTSGTNVLSKRLLHGAFYRAILQKSIPYVEKFLYVSMGCGKFMKEVYKIPDEKMEFFSLGGVIPTKSEIEESRIKVLKEVNVPKDSIIVLQAGKFDKNKRLIETLSNFQNVHSDNMFFLIIGSISEDIKESFYEIIKEDERIKYLGWKSGEELDEYLNACDIYLQPGKVSATAQNAICRECAVILNALDEYKPFVKGNGWLIDEPEEITEILNQIKDRAMLETYKESSKLIAKKYFDYNTISKRIYE